MFVMIITIYSPEKRAITEREYMKNRCLLKTIAWIS